MARSETQGTIRPLLVAGPCAIESLDQCLQIARAAAASADRQGFDFVFKASFDKANRTSGAGYRGPGVSEGLEILAEVSRSTPSRVLTDIHEPAQAALVAPVVDVLQIPAFLCRQTDLLVAAGRTGKTVNLKKGPFLAPWAVGPAVAKLRAAGAREVWVTERGTSFGHGDLVVDFRGTAALQAAGDRVLFDGGHSAQRPGHRGDRSGGDRSVIPTLCGAAAGAGYDALYIETHPDPDEALSDPETQWPLHRLDELLSAFAAIVAARRSLQG